MPADQPAFDVSAVDLSRTVADLAAIRAVLPQRYEFEMLTAISLIDPERHRIVGYKDTSADDFWVRGHLPGYPLMPGVMMCEAAAQLCSYYVLALKVVRGFIGLAGIEEARFHRPVKPGERLVLLGEGVKIHRRLTKFKVTGYVGTEKTFETVVTGVAMGMLEDLTRA